MKLPDTILITGANGQSAIHVAEKLLKQKCRLFLIVNKRTERIDVLKKKFPDKCWIKNCDLTDYEQTEKVLQDLISKSGLKPDGLVHTAAIRSYDAKALSDSEPEVWKEIFWKNVMMTYNIVRCVLPVMQEQKQGKIVLFGSNVIRTGLPYGSAYAAAKSALANLVRSLAWENAGYNVQINIVSPAPIETKLEEDYEGQYLKFRQEYFEAYKKTHPASRLVSLNDVSEAVLSLLNLELTSLSGEDVFLTGGVL